MLSSNARHAIGKTGNQYLSKGAWRYQYTVKENAHTTHHRTDRLKIETIHASGQITISGRRLFPLSKLKRCVSYNQSTDSVRNFSSVAVRAPMLITPLTPLTTQGAAQIPLLY